MAENSSSTNSEYSATDDRINQPKDSYSFLADSSSVGSLGDFFGESRREGTYDEHRKFGGGLFNELVFTNRRKTISTLNNTQLLRLDTISQVLFKPSKCGIFHFCYFSIRVNVPDRAVEYVRKYIHKMA